MPDEVVPSPSPIRSSRSAKSNNSCWICGICACRASCLIFSAIARLSSPLPSRSLLIGVSSTESDSRRRRGASVSLPIGTPERADMSPQTWLIDGTRPIALGTGMRRNVAAVFPPECNVCYASHQQKRKNTMEERQGIGTQSGDQHYREIASKLREIARECRFPGARREILDLASRLERRADELDPRSGSTGSGRTIN